MSVWSELKRQTRITNDDLLMPLVKSDIVVKANNILPPGTISFDLETGAVAEMWRSNHNFIRLTGFSLDDNPVHTTEYVDELVMGINHNTGWIIGHNILNFDLILLDRIKGISILDLAKKDRIRDTKLLAFLADPPLSRTKEGEIEKIYSLENQGQKYLGVGKFGNLKELAKKYGGFDKIPTDNYEYDEYLKRDVEVTRDLAKAVEINDYAKREHKIAAIASTISLQGFRVDVDLLKTRIQEGERKKHQILTSLMEYGLPGPETSKSPHRTNAGVAAINIAFKNLSVELPRTPTGRPSLGKGTLQTIVDIEENPEVIDLAEAVMSLNGIRTINQNVFDNLVGDRVHPSINLRQSTGRLSIQNPGMTVLGKKAGKYHERDVFLAEPGEVIVAFDLAQIDQRAVAALSQDYNYIDMFEPGKDFHCEVAHRVWGDKSRREEAKPISHGVAYGMGSKKLALQAGISVDEADSIINTMHNQFSVLVEWQHKTRESAELGEWLDNGFGRKLNIDPERTYTQSIGMMGQACARDLLMEGILRLWDMGGNDVIQMLRCIIHDEIVCSFPEKDAEELERLVLKALTFPWAPSWGTREIMIEAAGSKKSKIWGDVYSK